MKQVPFDENDQKQLIVVVNLLLQAEFKLKGDALGTAATGVAWAARLLDRVKSIPVESPVGMVAVKEKAKK